jgi:O-antigen ligase
MLKLKLLCYKFIQRRCIKLKGYLIKFYNLISNSFYLKLLYLFVSLSFVTILFDFSIFKILNKICMVWALILFLISLIEIITKKRRIFIFNIFLYIFLAITLFFTVYKYPTNENYKVWILNVLILMVLFSIDNFKNEKILLKELDWYSYFYAIFTSITSSISLLLIIVGYQIQKTIINADGVEELLVFTGLFKNENALGIASAISLIITLYLVFKCKSIRIKLFLIFNSIIQLITLFLSGGRSGYLVLLSIIFTFVFIYIKNNFLKGLMLIIPIISIFFIFKLDAKTLHYIFTGREYIWIAAIRIIKFAFFSGIGTSNTIPTLIQNQPADLIGVTKGGIHNIYMEITTVNGFLATLMILLFILSCLIYGVYKISKFSGSDKLSYTILLGLLLSIPVVNLMESNLVYIISFISLIYWFYAGHFISLLYNKK